MKRKDFIKNSLFAFVGSFLPPLLTENKNSFRYKFGYVVMNRKYGETTTAISEVVASEYKLQHMIIKSVPAGKYVDLKLNCIKNALHGMD